MKLKYLDVLDEPDDNALPVLLNWLNSNIHLKMWRRKIGSRKIRVSRTGLTETRDLVIEIMTAAEMLDQITYEPEYPGRVPFMAFGSVSKVDWLRMQKELRYRYGHYLKSKADEESAVVEGQKDQVRVFLEQVLATRLYGPRTTRKLSNKLLSRLMYLDAEWSETYQGRGQQWPPDYLAQDNIESKALATDADLLQATKGFLAFLKSDDCQLDKKDSAASRIEGMLP